jgi:hypothetical protein
MAPRPRHQWAGAGGGCSSSGAGGGGWPSPGAGGGRWPSLGADAASRCAAARPIGGGSGWPSPGSDAASRQRRGQSAAAVDGLRPGPARRAGAWRRGQSSAAAKTAKRLYPSRVGFELVRAGQARLVRELREIFFCKITLPRAMSCRGSMCKNVRRQLDLTYRAEILYSLHIHRIYSLTSTNNIDKFVQH